MINFLFSCDSGLNIEIHNKLDKIYLLRFYRFAETNIHVFGKTHSNRNTCKYVNDNLTKCWTFSYKKEVNETSLPISRQLSLNKI